MKSLGSSTADLFWCVCRKKVGSNECPNFSAFRIPPSHFLLEGPELTAGYLDLHGLAGSERPSILGMRNSAAIFHAAAHRSRLSTRESWIAFLRSTDTSEAGFTFPVFWGPCPKSPSWHFSPITTPFEIRRQADLFRPYSLITRNGVGRSATDGAVRTLFGHGANNFLFGLFSIRGNSFFSISSARRLSPVLLKFSLMICFSRSLFNLPAVRFIPTEAGFGLK